MDMMTRRRAMMAGKKPDEGPVTDGLIVSYTMDSVDWDNLKWSDEKGNGGNLTIATTDSTARFGFPNIAASRGLVMSVTKFNNLIAGDWSIEMTSYNERSNDRFRFATNKNGSQGTPALVYHQFIEASGHTLFYDTTKNTYRHDVLLYNSVTEEYTLYGKGVNRGSLSKTVTPSGNFRIGGWGINAGTLRIYNRCLTPEEITQNHNYEVGRLGL